MSTDKEKLIRNDQWLKALDSSYDLLRWLDFFEGKEEVITSAIGLAMRNDLKAILQYLKEEED